MKSNKVAPVSCYCKLSVLMLHLKNLSGRPVGEMTKGAALLSGNRRNPDESAVLNLGAFGRDAAEAH